MGASAGGHSCSLSAANSGKGDITVLAPIASPAGSRIAAIQAIPSLTSYRVSLAIPRIPLGMGVKFASWACGQASCMQPMFSCCSITGLEAKRDY